MHRMRQSMRDDLGLYGWLVGVAALGMSLWLLYMGLGGEAATLEQHGAYWGLALALGIFAIVGAVLGIAGECWWSGFAYTGVCAAAGLSVYVIYAPIP